MTSRKYYCIALILTILLTGCGQPQMQEHSSEAADAGGGGTAVAPSTEIEQLEDDLFTLRYDGAYGLAELMQAGGASTDQGWPLILPERLLPEWLSITSDSLLAAAQSSHRQGRTRFCSAAILIGSVAAQW